MNTDIDIINLFYKGDYAISSRFNPEWIRINQPEIYDYLISRYTDSQSIQETIYRIKHNINIHPVCPVCGKSIIFKRGFTDTCSLHCAAILSQDKKIQTCRQQYGTDYYVQSDDFKNQSIEKFGTDNPAQSDICKEKSKYTCNQKYHTDSYSQTSEWHEQVKLTNNAKFGVDNPMLNPDIKHTYQQTCLERFDDICPSKNPDVKKKIADTYRNTCQEKYGVDNIWQLPVIKDKIIQSMNEKFGVDYPLQNPEVLNQTILTNIEKYGVEWFLQTVENIEKSHSPEANEKRYQTHKKNNSFNKSGIEDEFEQYLMINYKDDYIRQYKSDIYPFMCDFYIKSIDLYIEIQGTWTHGGHPYNESNNEDRKLLESWKKRENASDYYRNAIYTWTIRDANKRNIASQNNLNYLEIFSDKIEKVISEFEKYIKTI